jgi:hypothetical protein
LTSGFRIPLDVVMALLAMAAAVLYVVTGRPRYQTAILLVVACVWGTEAIVLSSNMPTKLAVYATWHPIFAVTTSIAVIVLYLLRRRRG